MRATLPRDGLRPRTSGGGGSRGGQLGVGDNGTSADEGYRSARRSLARARSRVDAIDKGGSIHAADKGAATTPPAAPASHAELADAEGMAVAFSRGAAATGPGPGSSNAAGAASVAADEMDRHIASRAAAFSRRLETAQQARKDGPSRRRRTAGKSASGPLRPPPAPLRQTAGVRGAQSGVGLPQRKAASPLTAGLRPVDLAPLETRPLSGSRSVAQASAGGAGAEVDTSVDADSTDAAPASAGLGHLRRRVAVQQNTLEAFQLRVDQLKRERDHWRQLHQEQAGSAAEHLRLQDRHAALAQSADAERREKERLGAGKAEAEATLQRVRQEAERWQRLVKGEVTARLERHHRAREQVEAMLEDAQSGLVEEQRRVAELRAALVSRWVLTSDTPSARQVGCFGDSVPAFRHAVQPPLGPGQRYTVSRMLNTLAQACAVKAARDAEAGADPSQRRPVVWHAEEALLLSSGSAATAAEGVSALVHCMLESAGQVRRAMLLARLTGAAAPHLYAAPATEAVLAALRHVLPDERLEQALSQGKRPVLLSVHAVLRAVGGLIAPSASSVGGRLRLDPDLQLQLVEGLLALQLDEDKVPLLESAPPLPDGAPPVFAPIAGMGFRRGRAIVDTTQPLPVSTAHAAAQGDGVNVRSQAGGEAARPRPSTRGRASVGAASASRPQGRRRRGARGGSATGEPARLDAHGHVPCDPQLLGVPSAARLDLDAAALLLLDLAAEQCARCEAAVADAALQLAQRSGGHRGGEASPERASPGAAAGTPRRREDAGVEEEGDVMERRVQDMVGGHSSGALLAPVAAARQATLLLAPARSHALSLVDWRARSLTVGYRDFTALVRAVTAERPPQKQQLRAYYAMRAMDGTAGCATDAASLHAVTSVLLGYGFFPLPPQLRTVP